MGEIIDILKAAADDCLKSSQGNGDYNDAFYVAHIVLLDIAKRLAAPREPRDGSR